MMNKPNNNNEASAAADKPAQIPVWEQYPVGSGTMRAYADCHGKFDERSISTRNLDFRAARRVNLADAIAIMKRAIRGGYNEFQAESLKFLPPESRVRLARESSVCVYVDTRETLNEAETLHAMCASEFELVETFDGVNTYRIWWD